MSEVRKAAEAVIKAVREPGPAQTWHYATLERHRREWPILWRRIDALAEALASPPEPSEEP